MQLSQDAGFAPTPAHGADCATPGGVATTENGAKAMATAVAIPSAFISFREPPCANIVSLVVNDVLHIAVQL
jgi:hypothetical protein